MAQLVGARSTAQVITETRLVRRVDNEIAMLEGAQDKAPIITFLNMLDKRKAVDSPRYEWFEDDYVARWTTSTQTINSSATSMTVADGTLFVAGDIFIVPNADSSATAPEIVQVTAVSTNTLTIVRGFAGSSAAAITSGDALRLLGNAYEETFLPPTAKSTAPAAKISYTQIFSTTCNHSNTQIASKAYGAAQGERQREQKKKLIEHKEKMNISFLFGKASESNSGGPNGFPIRTTMGLNTVISTNATDAGGVLTRKTMESFAASAFRYGNKEKMLLACSKLISAIHDWGNSQMQCGPMEKVYGVNIQKIQTGHGMWLLMRDWMLENGVANKNGFRGYNFSVDVDSCEYFYLQGNGENRDTHLIENAIMDGRDAKVDQYKTEGGVRYIQEKRFAKLYDVTDYSA